MSKAGATLGVYSLFDLYQWSTIGSSSSDLVPTGDVLVTSQGGRIKTSQGSLVAIAPDSYGFNFSKSFNSFYLGAGK